VARPGRSNPSPGAEVPSIVCKSDDVGAIAVFDAVILPRQRMLLALGELGMRLVSHDGKTLAQFAQPAHELVISDHEDRVIALAQRGEAFRLARVDLVSRRVQSWCDARFHCYARTFDGSVWYVATNDTIYAIDALDSAWDALCSADAWAVQLHRSDGGLEALVRDGQSRQRWRFDVPSLQLRERRDVEDRPLAKDALDGWRVVVAEAGQDREVLLLLGETKRATIRLEGSSRASARLQHDAVVVCDERGRVIVLSVESGRVIHELRVT